MTTIFRAAPVASALTLCTLIACGQDKTTRSASSYTPPAADDRVTVEVNLADEAGGASLRVTNALSGFKARLSDSDACWDTNKGQLIDSATTPIVVRRDATGCALTFTELRLRDGNGVTLTSAPGLASDNAAAVTFADAQGARKLVVKIPQPAFDTASNTVITLRAEDLALAASVAVLKSCFLGPVEVPHLETITAFKNLREPAGGMCQSKVITCNDGEFTDPLYRARECSVAIPVRPALALRQANCLLCHGDIRGDVITDFGAANEPHVNRDGGTNLEEIVNRLLIERGDGMRPLNWATANIKGSLFVPQVMLKGDMAEAFGANRTSGITLASALRTSIQGMNPAERANTLGDTRPIVTVGTTRNQSSSGVDAITTAARVEINPPTWDELTQLASRPDRVVATGVDGNAADPMVYAFGASAVTGFKIKAGAVTAAARYVVNNGSTISCNGDVLVQGTLVLSSVTTLNVGADGCRLYVSEHILVKGGLKASATSPNKAIQFGAGRSIVLGIKHARMMGAPGVMDAIKNAGEDVADAGPSLLMYRRIGGVLHVLRETFHHTPLPAEQAAFVKANAAHWGNWTGSLRPRTPDESCLLHAEPAAEGQCFITHTNGNTAAGVTQRTSANYEGVLFAAKEIHSRYYGLVKGVVIADFALFALGALRYEQDNLFQNVDGLPKLARPMIIVGN